MGEIGNREFGAELSHVAEIEIDVEIRARNGAIGVCRGGGNIHCEAAATNDFAVAVECDGADRASRGLHGFVERGVELPFVGIGGLDKIEAYGLWHSLTVIDVERRTVG